MNYKPADKKGNILRGERSEALSQAKLLKQVFTETLTEKQQKDKLHLELYAQSLKVKDMSLNQFIQLTKTGERQT